MPARFHDHNRLRGIARDARALPRQHAIDLLIDAWNYATAPNVLRDDREHERCRRLARAIDGRLRRMRARFGTWSSGARHTV